MMPSWSAALAAQINAGISALRSFERGSWSPDRHEPAVRTLGEQMSEIGLALKTLEVPHHPLTTPVLKQWIENLPLATRGAVLFLAVGIPETCEPARLRDELMADAFTFAVLASKICNGQTLDAGAEEAALKRLEQFLRRVSTLAAAPETELHNAARRAVGALIKS